jgi:NAD(P)-dependent dehydrogenase (short-subunit alcohol dehydrogenase family)
MSKFHAKSSASEVIESLNINLNGYEAIVTGGASGIGVETVRALAKAGARVIIATRNLKNAQDVAEQLKKETGCDKIEAEQLDLSSLANVREFVRRYLAKNRYLNILINNAGIMATPQEYTEDGFESQFGTNHLGHFALAHGLLDALKQGAKAVNKNSRVVSVSSLAHIRSDIVFDDVNFRTRDYEPWSAYGQSKTANVFFAVGLSRKYAKDGVLSNAVMPGGIMTNLQKYVSKEEQMKRGWIDKDGNVNEAFKNVEQGASTSIWAAVAPELENKGGLYLEDCAVSKIKPFEEILKTMTGYREYAVDIESADKLWEMSEQWIRVPEAR